MIKLRIKHGILLIPVLLFVLAGCKKENHTSSFSLDSTDIHFLYGQTKNISYTARRIQRFENPTYPTGWNCTMGDGIVVITAPQETNGGAESEGTVVVSYVDDNGNTWRVNMEVAVVIPEDLTGNANCYIVSEPGKRYRFEATKKGNEASGTLSPKDADLVWATSRGSLTHVSCEDGYIYFSTADTETLTEANAVIAAKDGEGDILWSWHIWATDYDPEENTAELAGEQVMNRNLGAMASSRESTDDVFKSYGLYYQWGRKDPFVGTKEWNGTAQGSIYEANGVFLTLTFEVSTSRTGTIEYAIANPTTFIVGAKSSSYDWLYADRQNSLWGNASASTGRPSSKGSKSIYDPCPVGWMVAPPYIWASFTTTGQDSENSAEFVVSGSYEYGWTFESSTGDPMYYPAAGRRSFGTGYGNYTNITTGDAVGFYWSNANISPNQAALLTFSPDYINPGAAYYGEINEEYGSWSPEGARAGGFPVRCVAE